MKCRGLAALAVLPVACFGRPTYECEGSEQCRVGDVMGVCEPDGVCSYGDGSCDSGRRYGPYAGEKAEQCVPVDLGSTGDPTSATSSMTAMSTSTSTSASSSAATMQSSEESTAACAMDCPGDEIWSTVAPQVGVGQANGVTVTSSGVMIAGEATIEDRIALVVAMFDAESGELASTFEWPSIAGGPDRGSAIASLGGGVVVAGVETTAAGDERGLVFRLDGASEVAWTQHYDTAGVDAFLGVAASDRVVAVGSSGSRALAMAWDASGAELYVRSFAPMDDAIAVALHGVASTDGGAAWLGGAIQTAAMQSDLWVRALGPSGGIVLDVPIVDATVAADVAYGVAPLPDGGAMVCGVVGDKARLARIDPAGGVAFGLAAEEDRSVARAIAIAGDEAIVVGSVGAEGERDAWIAAFAIENGESRWDASIGTEMDDEALALALGDDVAYVAGYRSDAAGPAIWVAAYRR